MGARSDDEARNLIIERAPARTDGPDALLERHEESARVRQALAALPESHRAVFELGVMEELPYRTIADSLGIPVGTVKSRMHTAVRKVREALEAESTVKDAIRARTEGDVSAKSMGRQRRRS